MTHLIREPEIEIVGHRIFVVSEQFFVSYHHARNDHQYLCVCGGKIPLAVIKCDGEQHIILALDEDRLDRNALLAFVAHSL